MSISMVWTSTMKPKTAASLVKFHSRLEALMAYQSGIVQNDGRTNAPWTDQTGNARNGLNAEPFREPSGHGIVFSHGVDYGIYLETSNGGRYKIIMPTLESALPRVVTAASQILGSL